MIIAVDFDGTLSNGHYPHIGQPNKPLFDALIKLKAQGHDIVLWTCRENAQLQNAVDWCKEQGLEFDAVNRNVPWIGFYSRKVCADVYIDDLAVSKDDWMMKLNSIYEDTKLRERFRGGPCEV